MGMECTDVFEQQAKYLVSLLVNLTLHVAVCRSITHYQLLLCLYSQR